MTRAILPFCLAFAFVATAAAATPDAVPGIINHQGRISVSSVNFTGTGRFRFSLMDGAAASETVLWHHDGTVAGIVAPSGPGAAKPTGIVLVAVSSGLYTIALGDTAVSGMVAIPPSVFQHADVRLRIWFTDQVNPEQQLSPDIRILTVGYAMRAAEAASVDTGVITAASVLDGTLTGADLSATAAITDAQVNNNLTIVAGAVDNTAIGATTASTGKFTSLDATGTTRLGDLTTNYTSVSATGVVTYAGSARPKRTTTLMPATATVAGGAGSATVTTANGSFPNTTLDFANDGTTRSSAWQFIVPDSCVAGGNIDVTLYWTSTATSGNCGWQVDVDGHATDGTAVFDGALANTGSQSDAAAGVAGAAKAVTITLASGWSPGEIGVVKVSRTSGSDTLAAIASLVMVKVEWTASAESD
jgi:hypothetical protein